MGFAAYRWPVEVVCGAWLCVHRLRGCHASVESSRPPRTSSPCWSGGVGMVAIGGGVMTVNERRAAESVIFDALSLGERVDVRLYRPFGRCFWAGGALKLGRNAPIGNWCSQDGW